VGNIAAVAAAPAEPDATVLGDERTAPLPRVGERHRSLGRFPKPPAGRHLGIEDGDGVLLVALDRPVLHLGRSPSADVLLDDATVSRRHAVIAREGEDTVLLDNRSRNGVLLNGARVSRAVLRHGDQIQLGRVVMRYLDVA
jgi:FHA domain